MTAFFTFASSYRYLLHFNGTTFDIPFILHKCARHKLDFSFDNFESIDLYKKITPCKYLLKLPNCKQKTLELFLGISREDIYDGGELVGLYHEYVKAPSSMTEQKILLHRTMKKLKSEYFQVLYLIYFEGFTNSEAATIMKKSKRQIENLIYRSKNALKAELVKEGFSYEEL